MEPSRGMIRGVTVVMSFLGIAAAFWGTYWGVMASAMLCRDICSFGAQLTGSPLLIIGITILIHFTCALWAKANADSRPQAALLVAASPLIWVLFAFIFLPQLQVWAMHG